MTGVEIIAGISAVIAAAGTAASMQASAAQSSAANSAAERNYQIAQQQQEEQQTAARITGQQQEEAAAKAKSDQMMRANQQLGALRVMAGEMGTGSGTETGLVDQLGYSSSSDISRIDSQYGAQAAQNQLSESAISTNYQSTIDNITNQNTSSQIASRNAATSSAFSGLGSALSIGSSTYRYEHPTGPVRTT